MAVLAFHHLVGSNEIEVFRSQTVGRGERMRGDLCLDLGRGLGSGRPFELLAVVDAAFHEDR